MKLVELALALLIFNIAASIVTHAALVDQPMYYESSYVGTFTPGGGSLPENISTSSETQQYTVTMDAVGLILGVVDLGWVVRYVPQGMREDFAPVLIGLQAIVGFLYAMALIELFMRKENILGGSTNG